MILINQVSHQTRNFEKYKIFVMLLLKMNSINNILNSNITFYSYKTLASTVNAISVFLENHLSKEQ